MANPWASGAWAGGSLWPLTSNGTNVTLASGQLKLPISSTPSLAFASGGAGVGRDSGANFYFVNDAGTKILGIFTSGAGLASTAAFSWLSGAIGVGTEDTGFKRAAAGQVFPTDGGTGNGFLVQGAGTGTGTYIPLGSISVQTSAAGVGNAADATDDTLFTYSLPLNSLSANGKSLRVRGWGKTAANVNNKTIKLWFAGATAVTSGAIGISNLDWSCEMEITRIDATHVSVVSTYEDGGFANGVTTVTANLLVADLTANASIIKVTGASAASAANDVLGHGMKVWFEN